MVESLQLAGTRQVANICRGSCPVAEQGNAPVQPEPAAHNTCEDIAPLACQRHAGVKLVRRGGSLGRNHMKKPYFRGAACLATAPVMPIGTVRYLEGLLEFLPFEVKMRFISIQIGGSSLVERQLAPSSCHTQGQGGGVFQSGKELILSFWEILAFDNLPPLKAVSQFQTYSVTF